MIFEIITLVKDIRIEDNHRRIEGVETRLLRYHLEDQHVFLLIGN